MHRMIIDTDTAADDSFALLIGLLHPKAKLEAVTIVNGNVGFDQEIQNALITIEAAGRGGEVPVHPGARVPLVRDWVPASAHGDGKGNHDFPVPAQRPSAEGAAEAIVRIVNANPGEIEILAIGPLTNIATALFLDRELSKKVKHLWIMGGCDNSVGNVTAAAEYNFYVDPDAADIVLQAGFATTIVTWTLTLAQAWWDEQQIARIAEIPTSLAEFFLVLDAPTTAHNASVGVAGSSHPDSLTAMLIVEPELIRRSSDAFVAVETTSELTRGYSLMDHRADRSLPNARIIDEVDADGFFTSYCRLLAAGARERG